MALAQGVGGNPYCDNVTSTDEAGNVIYEEVAITPEPRYLHHGIGKTYTDELYETNYVDRFSVAVYFYILMGMMVVSSLAFLLLNTLSEFKTEYVMAAGSDATASSSYDSGSIEMQHNGSSSSKSTYGGPDGSSSRVSSSSAADREKQQILSEMSSTSVSSQDFTEVSDRSYYNLLLLQAAVCFISNGAFPSIQVQK